MNREERITKVKTALLSMQRLSWEQGVAAQAFLESNETEIAILMAKDAVVRQSNDGRLAQIGETWGITDPAANGETVIYAAKVTGDPNLKNAADKMLEFLLNKASKTEDGTLCHFDGGQQIWVDSFYMAPPFLAAAGEYKEAVKQIEGFRRRLWNPEKRLYSHMWDEGKNEFARKDFWGVGNGWAAAGTVRVINILPDSMKEYKEQLIGYLRNGIEGCLAYLREDGLFHNVIDNPHTFVETNLSQMLSYSIYRAVKNGWLERNFLSIADKMREAVYKKVDEFGLVQGVCGSPHFDHSGTAAEGQAFFLLMEAAQKDLVGYI